MWTGRARRLLGPSAWFCEADLVVVLSQVLVLLLRSRPLGLDQLLPHRSGQTPSPPDGQSHVTAEDSDPGLFQNDDPVPPVLRRHSSSDISKQKFGTMPLVPIRGDESNSSMLSANQTLVSTSAAVTVATKLCKPPTSVCFLLQRRLHDRRTLSMYFVRRKLCLGGADPDAWRT